MHDRSVRAPRTIYDIAPKHETAAERDARLRLCGRAHLRLAKLDAPDEALAKLGPVELIDPRDQDDPVGATVRTTKRGGLQWLRARGVISPREAAAGEFYVRDRLIERELVGGPRLTSNALSDRIGGGSISCGGGVEDVAHWRAVAKTRARQASLILTALGAVHVVDAIAIECRAMSEAAHAMVDALDLHPKARERKASAMLKRGLAALVEFYGA